jgi:hypothetical protein
LPLVGVVTVEVSGEIVRRGRVGDAPGTLGVKKVDFVTVQFDVLEPIAVAKGVMGEF